MRSLGVVAVQPITGAGRIGKEAVLVIHDSVLVGARMGDRQETP